MPRRKQPTYTEVRPPIEKLDNVPGPEASGDVLKAHYRRVQDVIATHRYDDVLYMCHWCCDGEAELAFTKTDQPRGTRMYCTARCANAYSAYMQKVVMKGAARPQSTSETEPEATEAQLAAVGLRGDRVPAPTRGRRSKPTPNEQAIAAYDDDVKADAERHLRDTANRERERAREQPAKERKPRAKKEERTDGKCAKGLHDMTPDNRYEYNGNVWCRECRKASRAKSVEKRNGS